MACQEYAEHVCNHRNKKHLGQHMQENYKAFYNVCVGMLYVF